MTEIDLILWWSLLPAAGLLLSLVLLPFALRAKLLDNHPTCRRCSYDLIGAPIDSPLCPECGADIRAPKAIRIGRRARRPALTAAALLLLVASLAALALLGRRAAVAWRDDANKPAWWLTRQLDSKDEPIRDNAFTELNRRLLTGALSASQTDAAAQPLLAIQADQSIHWNPAWGDFLESARQKQLLSDALWRKYAEQGVVFTTRYRQTIRRGDRIPIQLVVGPCRVGLARRFKVEYKARDVTLDGQPITAPLYWQHPEDISAHGSGWITLQFPHDPALFQKLPDGPHRIQAVFDFDLYDNSNVPQAAPSVIRFSQTRALDFTLVPATTQTIELLTDASARSLVEQNVRVEGVEHYSPTVAFVSLRVQNLPFDFAADVVLRSGDRQWTGGIATMDTGSNGGTGAHVRVDPSFDAEKVDVIVRGSPDAARTTVEMKTIWGGELTFKNIPVKRERK